MKEFCNGCLKEFSGDGYRGYFCSQKCWHKCIASIRDGTWVEKNLEEAEIHPERDRTLIEPCSRYDGRKAEGDPCKDMVSKEHVFNRHWCSYQCFYIQRKEIAEKIKTREKKSEAARKASDAAIEYAKEASLHADMLESIVKNYKVSRETLNLVYSEINKDFHRSPEWQQLRYDALEIHGRKCVGCGLTPNDGIKIHIDHIKPRSKHPELALDIENLQILCESCNMGKGNRYETDFRKQATKTRKGEE